MAMMKIMPYDKRVCTLEIVIVIEEFVEVRSIALYIVALVD